LPISKTEVSLASDISRQTGLLCGDALIVAVMRAHAFQQSLARSLAISVAATSPAVEALRVHALDLNAV
jgi:hypothetical protein